MGDTSCPMGWGPKLPRAAPLVRRKGSWEGAFNWVSPTPTPEYKKSFENDAQSSDNINFLKVQWSSRQLPTVRLHAGPGFVGEAQREVQQSEFGEGRQRQQSAHISMHVVG